MDTFAEGIDGFNRRVDLCLNSGGMAHPLKQRPPLLRRAQHSGWLAINDNTGRSRRFPRSPARHVMGEA